MFVKKYAYLKYASRPKSIATERQRKNFASPRPSLAFTLPAINQSESVTKARMSKNKPLVL